MESGYFKCFRSIRKSLINNKGYFLFDVWYGSGAFSDKPMVRVKEAEDEANKLIKIERKW